MRRNWKYDSGQGVGPFGVEPPNLPTPNLQTRKLSIVLGWYLLLDKIKNVEATFLVLKQVCTYYLVFSVQYLLLATRPIAQYLLHISFEIIHQLINRLLMVTDAAWQVLSLLVVRRPCSRDGLDLKTLKSILARCRVEVRVLLLTRFKVPLLVAGLDLATLEALLPRCKAPSPFLTAREMGLMIAARLVKSPYLL